MSNFLFCINIIIICASAIYTQTGFQVAIGGSSSEEGRSIVQAYDGGYVAAGTINNSNNNIYIVKISTSGQLDWTKTIGGTGSDDAYSITRTLDSGYAVTGATNSSGAGNSDVIVIKLNKNGDIQWIKTYGGPGTDYGNSIIQNSDGNITVGGLGTFGNSIPLILKINLSGDLLWSKTIGGGIVSGFINDIIITDNNGYAFTGNANSGIITARTDSAGLLIWSRIFIAAGSTDMGKSIIQSSDSGFAVAANTYTGFNARTDYYLIKFSKNGAFEWNRNYGELYSSDAVAKIFPSQNGGFYIAGGSTFLGVNSPDAHIVKYSNSGEVLWGRFIGNSGIDVIYSCVKTSDNGYVFTGSTTSFGSGIYDLYILKLDSLWNGCGNYRDTLQTTNGPLGNPLSHTAATVQQNLTVTNVSIGSGSTGTLTINCILTGVQNNTGEIPEEYFLGQNYPNPFNPSTVIKYSIPVDDFVNLTVFNQTGKEIAVLNNEFHKAGNYEAVWNAENYPSGIYFYRLQSSDKTLTGKMVLLK